jgi:hypothetical protein
MEMPRNNLINNLIEKSLKTIDNFVDFNILKISKIPAPILFE